MKRGFMSIRLLSPLLCGFMITSKQKILNFACVHLGLLLISTQATSLSIGPPLIDPNFSGLTFVLEFGPWIHPLAFTDVLTELSGFVLGFVRLDEDLLGDPLDVDIGGVGEGYTPGAVDLYFVLAGCLAEG